MKKSIVIFLIIFNFNFSIAQKVLIVEYELERQMDIDQAFSSFEQSKAIPNALKNELIKKFTETYSYLLITNSNESNFSWVEKISNSQDSGLFSNISLGDIGLIHKSLETQTYQWETNLSNKNYIVSDSLKIFNWKLSKETKEILGYEVRQAKAVIDSITTVEAWYAPKLSYKNGPEYFGGLPGLILEISETKTTKQFGQRIRTYTAMSIQMSKKKKITQPKKGKIISKTEYEQLREANRSKRSKMFSNDGVDKD